MLHNVSVLLVDPSFSPTNKLVCCARSPSQSTSNIAHSPFSSGWLSSSSPYLATTRRHRIRSREIPSIRWLHSTPPQPVTLSLQETFGLSEADWSEYSSFAAVTLLSCLRMVTTLTIREWNIHSLWHQRVLVSSRFSPTATQQRTEQHQKLLELQFFSGHCWTAGKFQYI